VLQEQENLKFSLFYSAYVLCRKLAAYIILAQRLPRHRQSGFDEGMSNILALSL
jgi:hypothetical protein